MIWIIALIFSIIALVVGIIVFVKTDSDGIGWMILSMACVCVIIISFIVMITLPVSTRKYIEVFKVQKSYIESHVAASDVENAALTNKKIDLNTSLFQNQYSAKNYPLWNFYNEEILALEPIK